MEEAEVEVEAEAVEAEVEAVEVVEAVDVMEEVEAEVLVWHALHTGLVRVRVRD